MKSRKKSTIINVCFHYIQIILSLVTGIILIPVYLRFISIELYGSWLATGNIVIWLTMLNPGLAAVLMQKTSQAYGKKDYSEIQQLISTGILISAIIALAVAVVGYSLSGNVIDWLDLNTHNDNNQLIHAYKIAVISSALMIFAYSIISFNYGLQASLSIGITYTTATIIKIIAIITFLYFNFGLTGIALGELISVLIILFSNIIYLFLKISKEKIGITLKITNFIPLAKLISFTFTARFSKIASKGFDNILITRLLGPESTVLFNLTGRAMKLGETVISHPVAAFRPALSHLKGSNETLKAKKILLRLISFVFWLTGLLVVGFVSLNNIFVHLWVGKEFYAGSTINYILIVVFLLRAWTNSLNSICFALGNIKGNSIADFIQSIIFIPILYYSIKQFELIGAALAPILAIFTISIWYYPAVFSKLLSFKHSDVKKILYEFVITLIVTVLITSLAYDSNIDTWIKFTAYVFLLITLYSLVLFLFSKLFRSECAVFFKRIAHSLITRVHPQR